MLNRDIEIFYNLGLIFYGLNKLVGYTLGVAVQKANPLESVDFAKLIQKLTKHRFAVQVLTIAGGILCNNV